MQGELYVVGTPIGNLSDITKRALTTLESVDLVLCEDTRVTRKLMSKFGIHTPLNSYHQHSSEKKKLEILNMLMQGKSLALVTDAGTPGISDPGNELIDFLYEKTLSGRVLENLRDIASAPTRFSHLTDRTVSPSSGPTTKDDSFVVSNADDPFKVIVIPGVSAVTAALSVCGFRAGTFRFLGYFPKKKKGRVIKMMEQNKMTTVFFESPKRIVKTLDYLEENLGEDRRVFLGRELTKQYESMHRGKIKDVRNDLMKESLIKGEIVLIIE